MLLAVVSHSGALPWAGAAGASRLVTTCLWALQACQRDAKAGRCSSGSSTGCGS